MTNDERKEDFLRALAKYLVADQATKSIELQMNKKSATEWVNLRRKTPLFGYPTEKEAVEILREFLR